MTQLGQRDSEQGSQFKEKCVSLCHSGSQRNVSSGQRDVLYVMMDW